MEELYTYGTRWCVQVSLDPGTMHLFRSGSHLYHQRSQGDRKYRKKKENVPRSNRRSASCSLVQMEGKAELRLMDSLS